ncbi:MAG: hypothetical protein ABIO60_07950 [Aquaticitalea sp.]
MKNRNSKFNKIKYSLLSKLGSVFNLSFSSHELLEEKIFGVDGIKRKILVVEEKDGSNSSYIIELDKVKSISVKTVYDSIKRNDLTDKRLNEFLKTMHLQFEFTDGRDAVALPFFENKKNNIEELPMLERKTKNWKMIFSKMCGAQH